MAQAPAPADRLTPVLIGFTAYYVAAGFASLTPAKLSASGALANTFFASGTAFAPDVDVLVQVAYPLPFTFPFIGALATMTGTNSVLATATVRVEPYSQ